MSSSPVTTSRSAVRLMRPSSFGVRTASFSSLSGDRNAPVVGFFGSRGDRDLSGPLRHFGRGGLHPQLGDHGSALPVVELDATGDVLHAQPDGVGELGAEGRSNSVPSADCPHRQRL
ncbi:MAG: hypothetical protein QM658_02540 [Gordonia sp. (in: high G+C Gram-positive bacteria)]